MHAVQRKEHSVGAILDHETSCCDLHFLWGYWRTDCLMPCPSLHKFEEAELRFTLHLCEAPSLCPLCCPLGRKEAIFREGSNSSKVRAAMKGWADLQESWGWECMEFRSSEREMRSHRQVGPLQRHCGSQTKDLTLWTAGSHWGCMGRWHHGSRRHPPDKVENWSKRGK